MSERDPKEIREWENNALSIIDTDRLITELAARHDEFVFFARKYRQRDFRDNRENSSYQFIFDFNAKMSISKTLCKEGMEAIKTYLETGESP